MTHVQQIRTTYVLLVEHSTSSAYFFSLQSRGKGPVFKHQTVPVRYRTALFRECTTVLYRYGTHRIANQHHQHASMRCNCCLLLGRPNPGGGWCGERTAVLVVLESKTPCFSPLLKLVRNRSVLPSFQDGNRSCTARR